MIFPPRVTRINTATTLIPDHSTTDILCVDALDNDMFIEEPVGSPSDFQELIIRINNKDEKNVITWSDKYSGQGMPKRLSCNIPIFYSFMFDAVTGKYVRQWLQTIV